MTVLIVYGTNSSGTETVSHVVADQLKKAGHEVRVVHAPDATATMLPEYDVVLLGSCTWDGIFDGKTRLEGQLQEHMQHFVDGAKGIRLDSRPFAIFALGDSSYQEFCAAADHLEKFVQEVGGKLIVPSLRIDGYYFNEDKNNQAVEGWTQSVIKALA